MSQVSDWLHGIGGQLKLVKFKVDWRGGSLRLSLRSRVQRGRSRSQNDVAAAAQPAATLKQQNVWQRTWREDDWEGVNDGDPSDGDGMKRGCDRRIT